MMLFCDRLCNGKAQSDAARVVFFAQTGKAGEYARQFFLANSAAGVFDFNEYGRLLPENIYVDFSRAVYGFAGVFKDIQKSLAKQ